MENSLNLAVLLGLGGIVGTLTGLYAAGKKLATQVAEVATTIEKVLRDPRHADLAAVARECRELEQDAKTLLGMLKRVLK